MHITCFHSPILNSCPSRWLIDRVHLLILEGGNTQEVPYAVFCLSITFDLDPGIQYVRSSCTLCLYPAINTNYLLRMRDVTHAFLTGDR